VPQHIVLKMGLRLNTLQKREGKEKGGGKAKNSTKWSLKWKKPGRSAGLEQWGDSGWEKGEGHRATKLKYRSLKKKSKKVVLGAR